MLRSIFIPSARSRRPGPLAAGLLLLLALTGAPPAHANLNTTQEITVGNGETLTIADGDSVDTSSGNGYAAVRVISGGTLIVTGGSISAGANHPAILVDGGAATISGGSISSLTGVYVDGGTVTISGGSFSAQYGVIAQGGTVSLVGCRLQLATDGTLTGTLQDGTPISTLTIGLSASNLVQGNNCDTTAPTTTATATAGGSPYTAGTWTNQSVNVVLTAVDSGGSGTKEIVYSAAGDDPIDSTTVAGGTASCTIVKEGITTISFHAVDNAGNVEADQTFTVQLDKTGPTISFGTPTPAPNAAGWNNSSVSIPFTVSDSLSGVASATASSPLVLSTEGRAVSGTVTATDTAGNSTAAMSPAVNIDQTPPVVTYSGNAGSYSVDQMVSITCSASDALSGVASSTCQNITGPAYTFSLGLNSFSATATDNAGNTGSGSTSFTVQVTASSLGALVGQFVTDPAVVQGLQDKLTTIAQGNANAKAGAVDAFIHQVNAQMGKSLTAAQAAVLIQFVQAL